MPSSTVDSVRVRMRYKCTMRRYGRRRARKLSVRSEREESAGQGQRGACSIMHFQRQEVFTIQRNGNGEAQASILECGILLRPLRQSLL